MSYSGAIEYLYGLQQYGMKFGLDNIKKLLSALDNPHRAFLSVHVAGTNGKGSTSAIIESILRTAGVKTGLFTSPHLVSFTERIKVNGIEITEDDVIELTDEIRYVISKIEDLSPTFFEVVTAMAFLHFRRKGVEWAVIETGLGGRLDSTNVITPEVSVITRIGFDHKQFLGNTIMEIATEKAGIIKKNIPVVTAGQEHEGISVIQKRCRETDSRLYRYGFDFSSEIVVHDLDGIIFNYTGDNKYYGLSVPLAGAFQAENASLALKAIEILKKKYPSMSPDIRKGLSELRWPGRLEFVKMDPPILIDGAHNPAAAEELAGYLRMISPSKFKRIIMVVGIMADKDISGILKSFLPLASEMIFTSPAYGRAASVEMLSEFAAAMGYSSKTAGTVAGAISMACALSTPGDLIVVTGSFYTIGEAKEALGYKAVLARLRE